MEWFNPFGLVFITIIMIPNIVFAIRCKDGFADCCGTALCAGAYLHFLSECKERKIMIETD